jgi:hypothetical protein
MDIYWSLLVCLVGLVVFLITPGPPAPAPAWTYGHKGNVLGLCMFFVGLFVFLLQIGPKITGFAK